MISDKVVKAMNEQINMEYASAYIYLGMSLEMDIKGFKGYSSWLFIQYGEEIKHAEKFIDFIQRRGFKPTLTDISAPKSAANTPLEVAKVAYAHEMKVSASIDKIYELAVKESDYASASFLKWFIDEQVEEEENTRNIVDMFETAGNDIDAMFQIDKFLSKREE